MTVKSATETKSSGPLDSVATYLSNAIDRTDEDAALTRVDVLKESRPDAGNDELVASLIRRKCLRTGAMGALAPARTLIGIPLNLGLVFKWQAELVLEIAAVYGRPLDDREKRNIVLIVTGLSVGTTQLNRWITKGLERLVAQRVAKSTAAKATTPLIGSVTSASVNVIFTYMVGKYAQSYFSRDP